MVIIYYRCLKFNMRQVNDANNDSIVKSSVVICCLGLKITLNILWATVIWCWTVPTLRGLLHWTITLGWYPAQSYYTGTEPNSLVLLFYLWNTTLIVIMSSLWIFFLQYNVLQIRQWHFAVQEDIFDNLQT